MVTSRINGFKPPETEKRPVQSSASSPSASSGPVDAFSIASSAASRRAREIAPKAFRNYLQACMNEQGKRISESLPEPYHRCLENVCDAFASEGRDAGTIGALRYCVGRKLQEQI